MKIIQELWKMNIILIVAIIQSSRETEIQIEDIPEFFEGKINSTTV